MKASKSMHGCDSKDKETAYRAGYYAAINDTRRLIAESPIIIESLYHHNYYS